jgi:translation initiation factor IF-3
VNQRIRAREVRVIGADNEQLGIMPPQEALKVAVERGLDLVEVAPTANPPVCRIMDYGKYLYQLNKKLHEAKKHQKNITVKEVKFRPNTDEHDYEFKKNHIIRFLKQGDKVKATVFFRGREIVHQSIGRALLDRLVEELTDVGAVEAKPKMEGPHLTAIFAPKKA